MYQNVYFLFQTKKDTHRNKKQNKSKTEKQKNPKEEKEKENVVVVNKICGKCNGIQKCCLKICSVYFF